MSTISSACSAPSEPTRADRKLDLLATTASGPTRFGLHDHFIVDLDGTLLQGDVATEGAIAFIHAVSTRYVIVSNNSRDTSQSLSVKLRRLGLGIPEDRIVLAGEETIRFVSRQYPGARCLIAGSSFLRQSARREGLVTVSEQADVVVLSRDTQWSYEKLALLANEVRRGAALIVTNPDLSHPGAEGRVVPETGSLLAAVLAVAGSADARIIGKPERPLFLTALSRLGSTPAETVVVGDNPLTDQTGAFALGLKCVLVDPDRKDGRPNLVDVERHLRP